MLQTVYRLSHLIYMLFYFYFLDCRKDLNQVKQMDNNTMRVQHSSEQIFRSTFVCLLSVCLIVCTIDFMSRVNATLGILRVFNSLY